ncbi:MAG TPA: threonine synthase [Chitinophagaceae bacterium]
MITLSKPYSYLAALKCARCGTPYPLAALNTFAPCCNQPLVAEYSYEHSLSKRDLAGRPATMWRYREMLPVQDPECIVSLGEGMTPILPLPRLAVAWGFDHLLVKDEGLNPTGSFKARGLSMAVSKALELGVDRCIVPTAGNAGGALAAYCASAGMACTVVMPAHTPKVFKQECELYGAEVVLVEGLINDCARKVEELKREADFYDVSTLKEPYRLEGKKTMGYEIAEQLAWQLPDCIIYPAGGGTGLIGIWKAFLEMQQLGWVTGPLPKMIAVQSLNCNPIIRALHNPGNWKEGFVPRPSIANGLAVPYPFGMDLMQQVIDDSGGYAIAVSEEEILEGVREVAAAEGLLMAPEGAAAWKALLHLRRLQIVRSTDRILLMNTGSGYKYLENLEPPPRIDRTMGSLG